MCVCGGGGVFSVCECMVCMCVCGVCVCAQTHRGGFHQGPIVILVGPCQSRLHGPHPPLKKKKFILTVLLVSMKLNVIQTGLRLYIFLILKEIRWFHGTLKVMWPRTWVSRLVHSYFSQSRNTEDAQTQPRAWVKGHSGSWGMELGREWALHMNLLH